MTDLESAKAAIKSKYNYALSVYDYADHIRVTNGSAAMYIDIRLEDSEFVLRGKRYGESIKTRCDANTESLLSTLGSTV
jgi:hypothetical protein